MSHQAKKHFGQNFLTDILIKDRIIQACQLSSNDRILEIGPGQGAITELIAPQVESLTAVETDTDLIAALTDQFENTNTTIIHQNFLNFDLNTLPDQTKIISNLPYNIATPIIEKVITQKDKFTDFYMTVQLEYGQRLAAKPNSKAYGSLSCFVQYHADIEILFKISPCAFTPQPKVQSCFLHMRFKHTPQPKAKDETMLFRVIKSAFFQRRKTIINSLGSLFDKTQLGEILDDLKIDSKKRAENIALEDYIKIADRLTP